MKFFLVSLAEKWHFALVSDELFTIFWGCNVMFNARFLETRVKSLIGRNTFFGFCWKTLRCETRNGRLDGVH